MSDDTEDLLIIPAWLRRGTPENDKVREEGAARLKANPDLYSNVQRRTAPKTNRIAPSKTEKKRTKRSADAVVRKQLLDAGYSPGFAQSVSIAKAQKIVSDLISGLGADKEEL